ncbi:heterokaryon incompatibility protein-domain-containing protein [Xylariales sp. AK1849]|nr:heterokaryon incompatibility protein-domain-containing protein [Xylariales sp. AK1849]
MRLINTGNLEIHEFFGDRIPVYAILSHTWGKGEVTLQDMGSKSRDVTTKPGYQKIQSTCTQAAKDNYSWAWIDTCCIDKTSSAELSEAINSMYQWYSKSAVCYAYLADFSKIRPEPFTFEQSRWFTRGWTLQELIAPSNIIFFDVNWSRIGSLDDAAILEMVQSTTSIPAECLRRIQEPSEFSVAKRMSWAADRHCTRDEDIAYSLMGLFEVNMPLLYGEGEKAFTRLQEEILKDTDDHTILAWTVPPGDVRNFAPVGVLATSPADFASCGELENIYMEIKDPSTMTKLGLSIRLRMELVKYPPLSHLHQGCLEQKISVYRAVLNCGLNTQNLVILRLALAQRHSRDGPSKSYYRLGMWKLEYGRLDNMPSDIYIAKRVQPTSEDLPFGFGGLHLQCLPLSPSLGGNNSRAGIYDVSSVRGPWPSSSTSERKVRLFKRYGCVQFLTSDLGDYNSPIYINFVPADGFDPFYLVIGYAENWIHLEYLPRYTEKTRPPMQAKLPGVGGTSSSLQISGGL